MRRGAITLFLLLAAFATAGEPEWRAPLADAAWQAQPSWLGNPSDEHSVERKGNVTVFRVGQVDRGMKWSWQLPTPVDPAGRKYALLRYRGRGFGPRSDYALCVLGKVTAGLDYQTAIHAADLIADGRWRWAIADAPGVVARFTSVTGLAIQVQAVEPDAWMEVSDIRFANDVPLSTLADAVDWRPGAVFGDVQPLTLEGDTPRELWNKRLSIADWFTARDVTVHGIPFQLHPEAEVAETDLKAKADLRLPCGRKASEVYLLLLAQFTGQDEPTYGSGRLTVLRDVDRFRLRLEYADGTVDECLPMNVASKQFGIVEGPQGLVAAADPAKTLETIVLRDACKQGAFAVAGVSVRAKGGPAFPEAREETRPLRVGNLDPASGVFEVDESRLLEEERVTVTDPWLEARLRLTAVPMIESLIHRPTNWALLSHPCPLVEVTVDGQKLTNEDFSSVHRERAKVARWSATRMFSPRGDSALRFGYSIRMWGRGDIELCYAIENKSKRDYRVAITAPVVRQYRLGSTAMDSYYLVPRRGAAFDNRPCSYRERSSGLFPAQFLDTFNPVEDCGLALVPSTLLQPLKQSPVRKQYFLRKEIGELTVGVEYPERVLRPGETWVLPTTCLKLTDGDWHRGLEAYWESTKRRSGPLCPRRRWFREVFSFRQRFLHMYDPIYDAKTGAYRFDEAIAEDRREFGGVDYLHLFDWGYAPPYGRVYGRTGDHSPYDFLKGGRDALRAAIAGVQKQGIPVGLYIEGYLLTKNSKLGKAHLPDWQIRRRDGSGYWWSGNVEAMMCPGVKPWREVQASTYETKVKELDVDGVYIDQFGFGNVGKDCWSDKHGHPVPSYCVRTEREMTRLIRERVEAAKKNVALYTEETPIDLTTPFQDGSFTYAMFSAQRSRTLVPLNMARFAFPDFKTIEILVCDKPTGSWATGVRWVFFNGEALWIEGPPEWFEPETRAEIRRCYRILREHRDAFTSLEPEPLVPTQMGGVWANRFPVKGKTVYTLYNARHRTVRGAMLRVRHIGKSVYYDEWRECPATVRRDGEDAVLSTEVGPHGVGCLVVTQENPPE
jgi:hypothetical protein